MKEYEVQNAVKNGMRDYYHGEEAKLTEWERHLIEKKATMPDALYHAYYTDKSNYTKFMQDAENGRVRYKFYTENSPVIDGARDAGCDFLYDNKGYRQEVIRLSKEHNDYYSNPKMLIGTFIASAIPVIMLFFAITHEWQRSWGLEIFLCTGLGAIIWLILWIFYVMAKGKELGGQLAWFCKENNIT